MKKINTETFCAAPWFMLRYEKNGNYSPCCEFNYQASLYKEQKKIKANNHTIKEFMLQDYTNYVRNELGKGNKIKECDRCWKKEKAGLRSLRQTSNNIISDNKKDMLDKTWLHSFMKKKNKPFLLSADIKISNKCNFGCVMCNPEDSSKLFSQWSKDKKNNFVQEYLKNTNNYFQNIQQTQKEEEALIVLKEVLTHPSLRLIKLLGGEPLLEKRMLEELKNISNEKKKKISLSFCTNGSVNILSTIKKYKLYFKSLTFVVSLEGIGEMQDWARKGSDWSQIEKNILSAKKEGILIDIQNTLQAATLMRLHNLYDWCFENNIPLIFNLLKRPSYLSIDTLSYKLRNVFFESLTEQQKKITEKIKKENFSFPKESHPINLNNYLQEQFLPIDEENNKKFYKFIEWYEKDSKLKLKNIVPELYK